MARKAELRQLCVLSSCQGPAYFAIKQNRREFNRRAVTETWGIEFVLDQNRAGGLMRLSTKSAQRMV
ncbi:hypothetical protein ATO67_04510 [Agrobacterium bohemicum]|uniref:Uncharacterized protein n=1 Tax=Agrobacterium bohemicum TaxID=2052828 RepID=A0A135P390_9HYPH|nr:hypothetical protein ATO67_04510 [Agrobacterium bohemicum]